MELLWGEGGLVTGRGFGGRGITFTAATCGKEDAAAGCGFGGIGGGPVVGTGVVCWDLGGIGGGPLTGIEKAPTGSELEVNAGGETCCWVVAGLGPLGVPIALYDALPCGMGTGVCKTRREFTQHYTHVVAQTSRVDSVTCCGQSKHYQIPPGFLTCKLTFMHTCQHTIVIQRCHLLWVTIMRDRKLDTSHISSPRFLYLNWLWLH